MSSIKMLGAPSDSKEKQSSDLSGDTLTTAEAASFIRSSSPHEFPAFCTPSRTSKVCRVSDFDVVDEGQKDLFPMSASRRGRKSFEEHAEEDYQDAFIEEHTNDTLPKPGYRSNSMDAWSSLPNKHSLPIIETIDGPCIQIPLDVNDCESTSSEETVEIHLSPVDENTSAGGIYRRTGDDGNVESIEAFTRLSNERNDMPGPIKVFEDGCNEPLAYKVLSRSVPSNPKQKRRPWQMPTVEDVSPRSKLLNLIQWRQSGSPDEQGAASHCPSPSEYARQKRKNRNLRNDSQTNHTVRERSHLSESSGNRLGSGLPNGPSDFKQPAWTVGKARGKGVKLSRIDTTVCDDSIKRFIESPCVPRCVSAQLRANSLVAARISSSADTDNMRNKTDVFKPEKTPNMSENWADSSSSSPNITPLLWHRGRGASSHYYNHSSLQGIGKSDPTWMKEDEKLTLCFGEDVKRGTFFVNLEFSISLDEVDSEGRQRVNIPCLTFLHDGSVKGESTASLCLKTSMPPTISAEFDYLPRIRTLGNGGKTWHTHDAWDSPMIISSQKPSLLSVRARETTHVLSTIDPTVSTVLELVPTSATGSIELECHSVITLPSPETAILADQVSFKLLLRNVGVASQTFGLWEGQDAIHLKCYGVGGADSGDPSEGLITIIRSGSDFWTGFHIYYSIPITICRGSTGTIVPLPTIKPEHGEIRAETITLKAPPCPLWVNHVRREGVSLWKVARYGDHYNDGDRQGFQFYRMDMPKFFPEGMSDDIRVRVGELAGVQFKDLEFAKGHAMSGPVRDLKLSLWKSLDERVECRMSCDFHLGQQGYQTFTVATHGWKPKYSLVDGQLATEAGREWRWKGDGNMILLRPDTITIAQTIHVDVFFQWDSSPSRQGCEMLPIPTIVECYILNGQISSELEGNNTLDLRDTIPEGRSHFVKPIGRRIQFLPALSPNYALRVIHEDPITQKVAEPEKANLMESDLHCLVEGPWMMPPSKRIRFTDGDDGTKTQELEPVIEEETEISSREPDPDLPFVPPAAALTKMLSRTRTAGNPPRSSTDSKFGHLVRSSVIRTLISICGLLVLFGIGMLLLWRKNDVDVDGGIDATVSVTESPDMIGSAPIRLTNLDSEARVHPTAVTSSLRGSHEEPERVSVSVSKDGPVNTEVESRLVSGTADDFVASGPGGVIRGRGQRNRQRSVRNWIDYALGWRGQD